MVVNIGENFFLLKKRLPLGWFCLPRQRFYSNASYYNQVILGSSDFPVFSLKVFFLHKWSVAENVLLLNSLKHSHGKRNEIKTTSAHYGKKSERLGKGKIIEISQKLQNKTVK